MFFNTALTILVLLGFSESYNTERQIGDGEDINVLEISINKQQVIVGDEIILTCTLRGAEGRITWLKSWDRLPETARITGSALVLQIESIEDGGTYECEAHTEDGETLKSQAVVRVEEFEPERKFHIF